MTQLQSQVSLLIDGILNQKATFRKGGNQALYYCYKCRHYKKKLEICLEDGSKFGIFNCWTCGWSGNLITLLRSHNSPQSCFDKLHFLTKDIRLIRRKSRKLVSTDVSLPPEFIPLSINNYACVEYRNVIAYLKKRKITPIDILRHNIGYCKTGEYEYRIIVPSYDASGKLNFFIGREYYNAEGVIPYQKPDVSMNIVGFESFINYNESINIVEGCFDAFAVRNNAIPLFGKIISSKLQERLIVNRVKRVNMILDNDALHDAINNCKLMIRLGIEVCLVRLSGKDPSELGFEKIHELIRNAKPLEFDDLLAYELGI